MAIVELSALKAKFEPGDSPKSSDFINLIDTLAALPEAGASSAGVAVGGTAGQVLVKVDTTNYNTQWSTLDISGKQDVVANVSSTEIGYLDGVTSAIQTQINDKAPLASPTFTGTVSGVTKTHVGLGNVDNTTDANKPVSTATQTALNLKSNLSGPTFTGTVVLPSTTSIGDVSSTELGYLNNVTSAIQTQLDAKAPLASPTFTGTVAGITATHVGLGNVDNTTDLNKPISTSTQTALDLKSPLASPTFTGTPAAPLAVTGTNTTQIATTSFVQQELSVLTSGAPAALNTLDELAAALGDDSNYAATITTALGLKAPIASPTFTGTVTIPAGASISGFAPLESPTFTGTVSGVTKSHVGLGSVDNTADTAKPVSTAQQTALDSKANLSSNNTFSGGSIFSGAVAELSTTAGIHVGIASSTPRMMFVPTGAETSANNWQIDVASGVFRWFTPGVVQMSLSSGGIVTANSFVKNSGTSSQFLKADGSSDSSTYITPTSTNTLTNKRITSRVTTVTDASTPSPSADNDDMYILTALTQTATFAAPSGTPTQGQKLIVRVKDNGTARTLAWNAIYRASSDLSLPTITIASKTLYLGFIYNSTDTKWDLVSRINNF